MTPSPSPPHFHPFRPFHIPLQAASAKTHFLESGIGQGAVAVVLSYNPGYHHHPLQKPKSCRHHPHPSLPTPSCAIVINVSIYLAFLSLSLSLSAERNFGHRRERGFPPLVLSFLLLASQINGGNGKSRHYIIITGKLFGEKREKELSSFLPFLNLKFLTACLEGQGTR